jgi:hypothetical protein
MWASTFLTAFVSMSGPITAPGSNPSATLIAAGGLGETPGEGVIDAVLHQDAVGVDAGLAGVAVFGRDRALDRHLDVGVVEDDERRVAAETTRPRSKMMPSLMPTMPYSSLSVTRQMRLISF